ERRRLICEMFAGAVADLPRPSERRERDGATVFIYARPPYTAVFWAEGAIICVLVSDMNPEETIALAFAKAPKAEPARLGRPGTFRARRLFTHSNAAGDPRVAVRHFERSVRVMRRRMVWVWVVMLSLGFSAVSAARDDDSVAAVYTMSNAASGNHILVFSRGSDGSLSPAGSVATGGNGTGAGLGNQGGVVLTDDGEWLLAVNAGSNSVSVFAVEDEGLRLIDVAASGGLRPISIATHDNLVYVLNAGSDAVSGFVLTHR